MRQGEGMGHDRGHAAWPKRLSQDMDQVARWLQREHASVDRTLEAITTAAVRIVPGVQFAGLTLLTGSGTVEHRAGTDPVVQKLDAAQAQLGAGPSISAIRGQRTVRVDDISGERRWPEYTPVAAELGIAGLLSFPLFVAGHDAGALNLYATRPHAFHAAAEAYGLIFATHATLALAGSQRESQLRTGLNTRDMIGMAKGILIERFKITPDVSFRVLARLSQHSNIKLRDIAEAIVTTGDVPALRGSTCQPNRSHEAMPSH